jgi:hypothetical protein
VKNRTRPYYEGRYAHVFKKMREIKKMLCRNGHEPIQFTPGL